MKRDDLKIDVNSDRICTRHFVEDDYISGKDIKRLKLHAVPTVFDEYVDQLVRNLSLVCLADYGPLDVPWVVMAEMYETRARRATRYTKMLRMS